MAVREVLFCQDHIAVSSFTPKNIGKNIPHDKIEVITIPIAELSSITIDTEMTVEL